MKLNWKKPSNLIINIEDPKPINSQHIPNKSIENKKNTKQIIIRQKNQIQHMENQIRKLTNKIDSERHLLKNKILAQQFQRQLKKNQIAAQMSKRQIILRRLQLMRGVKQKQQNTEKVKKFYEYSQKKLNSNLKNQHSLQQINKRQDASNKQTIKQKHQKNNVFFGGEDSSIRLEKLKQVMTKQKQYGNRVQKQFVHNRSKSALSYLQIKRMQQLRKLQKQQQRQRILQQLKKPNIPIKINAQVDRKKQIDRIRASSQPAQQKLILLNYLSQVQLNRVKLKQIKGKQQDLQTLNHINRVRTSIILGRH